MFKELEKKEKAISVIGLGYVGLPLALAFARKFKVIGFDINEQRVAMMRNGEDPSKELESDAFEGCDITFTANLEDLKKAHFHVVAVPTPVDEHNVPDLKPVLKASESVGKALKKGDYVVYESTVYPGCTEEDCQPILENLSGLQLGSGFKMGYSPERINPGDKEHTIEKILKIVSGSDAEALEEVAKVYGAVIHAGIYKASCIKVAEAAKVIENTQRDLNIALVNELAIIFNRMGIDTHAVLEAAGTKWNFLPFKPGLVGGHCIGVDPYYLTHKAQMLGYHPDVILAGRRINDGMGAYVASQMVKAMIAKRIQVDGARVLVMGLTFKENCPDLRNTRVVDVIAELESYGCVVDVLDPWVDPVEAKAEYGLDMIADPERGAYDGIVLAVAHETFRKAGANALRGYGREGYVLYDLKSVLADEGTELRL